MLKLGYVACVVSLLSYAALWSAAQATPAQDSHAPHFGSGQPPATAPNTLYAYSSLPSRGLLPQDGEARIELEFWRSIEDSTDASDYEAYLETYPNGRFAPLARARAARYKKNAAKPPQDSVEPAPPIETLDKEYIVLTDANLRAGPSSQSALVTQVSKGSRLQVTGRVTDGNWFQVKAPTGETAYIYAGLVSETPPASSPVASPEPSLPSRVPRSSQSPISPPAPSSRIEVTELAPDCPQCPVMVALPMGSFTMGYNRGDRSERPEHKVTIKQPFAIGKYEVTTSQWQACVDAGKCSAKPDTGPTPNSPVRDVSWSDAQQYVRWLSQITQQPYRLPSEAEWEYAARAGSQTRYWWGEQLGSGRANCKDCGGEWDQTAPADVGAFPANPFGLHGMSGGVWEWVSDCWNRDHSGAPDDGSSRDRADCREHVIRGGSWRNDSSYVHSASRFKYDTNVRYVLNGFRVAKSLR